VVGEIVVEGDAACLAAHLHPPPHTRKSAQGFDRLGGLDSRVMRCRDCRKGVQPVVGTGELPAEATGRTPLPGHLESALPVRLARLPAAGHSEALHRGPAALGEYSLHYRVTPVSHNSAAAR